jgi:hypothetical protein
MGRSKYFDALRAPAASTEHDPENEAKVYARPLLSPDSFPMRPESSALQSRIGDVEERARRAVPRQRLAVTSD